MKNIVTLGGGGGHAQVLKGIKDIPDIKITAICTSADSGGSTGVLRAHYEGNGYLGDLTKCVVALSKNNSLNKALMHRFSAGPIEGHTVKNLLFLALEKTSSVNSAIETMAEICGLGVHRVIPVTTKKAELCAQLKVGNEISGETNIDNLAKNPLWNPEAHSIMNVYLKPKVSASPKATKAVKEADYIIISPGDLYSSIIPTLLPTGMERAIKESNAKIILILNIMTKKGETDNYTASDFINKIEKYLNKRIDYIVCNDAIIPKKILLLYSIESKVELGKLIKKSDTRTIAAPLAKVTKEGRIFTDPIIVKKVISGLIQ